MKKFVLILAALMVCTATFAQGLTILHLNDTHSHLDPLPTGEAGVLERTAFIDSVRNADGEDNVLLLHAGDFGQGSSYFTLLAGDLEISLINAMKYDCVALGNHEFDNGLEELGRRMSMLKDTKVVCANYDFSSFEAGKYVKPYTILEKAGKWSLSLVQNGKRASELNVVVIPYLNISPVKPCFSEGEDVISQRHLDEALHNFIPAVYPNE